LLIARDPIAFGATAEVLSASNLFRARAMGEAWREGAAVCDAAA
jgi:zinc/manganese transport system ATP-binding protein